MSKDIPTKLYKFQSFAPHTLSSLANSTFWFSHPKSFNDPFDSKLRYGSRKDQGMINACAQILSDKANILAQQASAALDEITKLRWAATFLQNNASKTGHYSMIKDFLNDFKLFSHEDWEQIRSQDLIDRRVKNFEPIEKELGILSLSKSCKNALLWSHYSGNHTGYCIELELDNLKLKEFGMHLSKVVYKKEMPDVIMVDEISDREEFKQLLDVQCTTKSECWSYEEEYRIISRGCNVSKKIPGKITGVIFGLRTSEEHKETIRAICKNIHPNTVFYEAGYEDGLYEIDVGPE